MYAVISSDGFIADQKGNYSDWTSKHDKSYLSESIAKYPLHIMGSRTYDVVLPKPRANTLIIVMTKHPRKYAELSVTGKLEFCSLSPKQICTKYSTYVKAALLGGSAIYSLFLQEDLVNAAYITRENSVTLKTGIPLLSNAISFVHDLSATMKKQSIIALSRTTDLVQYSRIT